MSRNFGPVRQIVVQATTFCNLDCRYCYLPHRDRQGALRSEDVCALMEILTAEGWLERDVELRWHAGEPLVLPATYYEKAIGDIDRIVGGRVRVEYSVQTNATTIDDDYARSLRRIGLRVGVSLDGPQEVHDANRRYRSGRGSYGDVIRGVEALKRQDVPFDVIAVYSECVTIGAEEYYHFFENLGARTLGLNIEESQGDFQSEWSPDRVRARRAFFEALYDMSRKGTLKVREFNVLSRLIMQRGPIRRDTQNSPGAIVALDLNRKVYTYSPELMGWSHLDFPDFSICSLDDLSRRGIEASQTLRRLEAEIEVGVAACRSGCEYFDVCGGGRPVNKLYETGSFRSTETVECLFRVKMLGDIVLNAFERGLPYV